MDIKDKMVYSWFQSCAWKTKIDHSKSLAICLFHNNTFNEGRKNFDVCNEQAKYEGNGATDFKMNAYITLSNYHYYKNHKTG